MKKSSVKLPVTILIVAVIAIYAIGSAYTNTIGKEPRYTRIGSGAQLPLTARAQADAPRDLSVRGSL